MTRTRWIAGCAAALCALAAGSALAAKDETTFVTRQSPGDGGAAANGNSRALSLSANGGKVAFQSTADNLSAADVATDDIFVRDLATGAVTLVSRRSNTLLGTPGAAADDVSTRPHISADGRWVAFASEADNLAGATYLESVFVRDLQTSRTELVSRATGATGQMAQGQSRESAISANGRFVAFSSIGSVLDGQTQDGPDEDVWLRDTVLDTTTMVSIKDDESEGGDSRSDFPSISADGRFVAFESHSADLSPDDGDYPNDIYVRDTVAGTTRLVSRQSTINDTPGTKGDAASEKAAISADGRFVAFESAANNLSASDKDDSVDVFVRDLQTETTLLVSRQAGADGAAGADAEAGAPAISADGRYVAFTSAATNLSDADAPGNDVFVRDLVLSTVALVSRQSAAAGGAGGDASSGGVALTPDGRFAGFDSSANNLSAEDDDVFRNGFVRDVLGASLGPALPGPTGDTTAPVLSRVRLTRARFRAARRGGRPGSAAKRRRRTPVGTTVRWSLSEDARTVLAVERALAGRRAGRRCRPPRVRPRGRRCTRWRAAGVLVLPGSAGANSAFFSGRVGRGALAAGTYRMRLRSLDTAGNRSPERRLRFRIVRR